MVDTISALREREGGTSVVGMDIVADRRLPGAMARTCVGHWEVWLVGAINCDGHWLRVCTGSARAHLRGGRA